MLRGGRLAWLGRCSRPRQLSIARRAPASEAGRIVRPPTVAPSVAGQPDLDCALPGIPELKPGAALSRPGTKVTTLDNGVRVTSVETYGLADAVSRRMRPPLPSRHATHSTTRYICAAQARCLTSGSSWTSAAVLRRVVAGAQRHAQHTATCNCTRAATRTPAGRREQRRQLLLGKDGLQVDWCVLRRRRAHARGACG